MYKVNRLCDINKIKPANIMYHVDRIFAGSVTSSSSGTQGDIVDTLSNLETQIDEKIALRRLNTLESKVDGLLKKLGVDQNKKQAAAKKPVADKKAAPKRAAPV